MGDSSIVVAQFSEALRTGEWSCGGRDHRDFQYKKFEANRIKDIRWENWKCIRRQGKIISNLDIHAAAEMAIELCQNWP